MSCVLWPITLSHSVPSVPLPTPISTGKLSGKTDESLLEGGGEGGACNVLLFRSSLFHMHINIYPLFKSPSSIFICFTIKISLTLDTQIAFRECCMLFVLFCHNLSTNSCLSLGSRGDSTDTLPSKHKILTILFLLIFSI